VCKPRTSPIALSRSLCDVLVPLVCLNPISSSISSLQLSVFSRSSFPSIHPLKRSLDKMMNMIPLSSKLRKLSNSLLFTFKRGLCFERLCRWQNNNNRKQHYFFYATFLFLLMYFFLSFVHTSSSSSSSSFSFTSSSSRSSSLSSSQHSSALISILKSRISNRDIAIGGFARRTMPQDPREFVRKLKVTSLHSFASLTCSPSLCVRFTSCLPTPFSSHNHLFTL
jgi:hypothetical protein